MFSSTGGHPGGPFQVLYTTLIKGFARAGQVDQAVQIYEEMRKDPELAVTWERYSTWRNSQVDSFN